MFFVIAVYVSIALLVCILNMVSDIGLVENIVAIFLENSFSS